MLKLIGTSEEIVKCVLPLRPQSSVAVKVTMAELVPLHA